MRRFFWIKQTKICTKSEGLGVVNYINKLARFNTSAERYTAWRQLKYLLGSGNISNYV